MLDRRSPSDPGVVVVVRRTVKVVTPIIEPRGPRFDGAGVVVVLRRAG